MLTKNELEQIKNYLALYGKKDSQLVKAVTPLTGKEYLSLVQDGVNKIAPFSEILETIDYPLDKDILSYEEYQTIEHKSTQTLYIITDDGTSEGNVIQIFLGSLPLRESGNNHINLSVTPSVIFLDNATTINVTAVSSKNADSIKIIRNGQVILSGSGTTVTIDDPEINSTTIYTAQASILGYSYADTKTVTAVNPIYYGSGSDNSDFWNTGKVALDRPTITPVGSYEIAVRNDGDFIYFALPDIESMEIHRITLGGFDFPIYDTESTAYPGYKIYKSANAFLQETVTIIIT